MRKYIKMSCLAVCLALIGSPFAYADVQGSISGLAAEHATSFEIQKLIDPATEYSVVDTIPATQTTWVDPDPIPEGTVTCYKVRAFNSATSSLSEPCCQTWEGIGSVTFTCTMEQM